MAFDVKGLNRLANFGVVGNNQPPSLWLYVTDDAHAAVAAANYFNAQAQFMRKGDIIDVITAFTGTPINRRYVVTNVTATVVSITAVTGASWT
jgi:hypothetical protein